MNKTKSIEKTLISINLVSAGLFIFAVFLKDNISSLEYKFFLAVLLLANLLLLIFLVHPEKVKRIMLTIIITVFLYLPIFLFFRQVRNLFPVPSLAGSEWVGFANYFKYPLYFDNLFFLAIVLIPVVIYFGTQRYEKKASS